MAISNGLRNVMFDTNSKTLVVAFQTLNFPCNEFGNLVLECKSLLSSNLDYIVSFISREKNKVAQVIARATLSHHTPYLS